MLPLYFIILLLLLTQSLNYSYSLCPFWYCSYFGCHQYNSYSLHSYLTWFDLFYTLLILLCQFRLTCPFKEISSVLLLRGSLLMLLLILTTPLHYSYYKIWMLLIHHITFILGWCDMALTTNFYVCKLILFYSILL